MKRKGILISIIVAVAIAVGAYLALTNPFGIAMDSDQQEDIVFHVNGKNIEIWQEDQWKPFQIVGVNMGAGYPGYFPNDSRIDQETYYRWLEMIGQMHANTVRVYKLQSPEFYSALLSYNQTHDEKIYLIQNIYFAENIMFQDSNIMDPEVNRKLFQDTYHVVDALHGKYITFSKDPGYLECYIDDVSQYVLGYILGIEWDETFVEYVCRINTETKSYSGTYFSCQEDANPFEIFLAQWGDQIASYEMDTYNKQHMISFCNWAESDPFANEFQMDRDGKSFVGKDLEVMVDIEHIHPTKALRAGAFISYNIYPYYPLFLQYGPYTNYIDDHGQHNPYRKYLMELVNYHTCPVVISEYGVPASRTKAHSDAWRNISHGGLNETQQGQGILTLFEDINKAGCAGSMIFSWQDEWYKRTWNEMMLSDPDGRAFWSNAQSAEQSFGLLAFDPGQEHSVSYVDGDPSEWSEKDLVYKNASTRLSIKSDERYVYFLAEGLDPDPTHALVNIALDITPKTGHLIIGNRQLEHPVDFLIQLRSSGTSAVYVDRMYDVLPHSIFGVYHDTSVAGIEEIQKMYAGVSTTLPESTEFSIAARADDATYGYLAKNVTINEVGRLKQGDGNPDHPNFDSNADYCINGDLAEIRIPWQLLNFYDPSQCEIIDDLQENDYKIQGLKIDAIHAAAYYDGQKQVDSFGSYPLESWETPQFHERLKQSYYILQQAFGGAAVP